jgi:hypothetical protein
MSQYSPQERLVTSGYIIKLAQSATDIKTLHSVGHYPRALWCGTAGTFTGTDAFENDITDFPLQVGENPISVATWTAGTADNVWALF